MRLDTTSSKETRNITFRLNELCSQAEVRIKDFSNKVSWEGKGGKKFFNSYDEYVDDNIWSEIMKTFHWTKPVLIFFLISKKIKVSTT